MPFAANLEAYRAVLAKVDAFAAATASRRGGDMRCRSGCDGCCHMELEVSPIEAAFVRLAVEALAPAARARMAARAVDGRRHRCAMLEEDGRCGIYASRPTVCRTQGLPLRYPSDFVPIETVAGKSGEDDVVWCSLNFTEGPPEGADVLDAERVDTLVGLANQGYCEPHDLDPLSRIPLRSLAKARER
ncbi:MAG: YkgJ family cysteine cluster protein [Myxococcota bacterium]